MSHVRDLAAQGTSIRELLITRITQKGDNGHRIPRGDCRTLKSDNSLWFTPSEESSKRNSYSEDEETLQREQAEHPAPKLKANKAAHIEINKTDEAADK